METERCTEKIEFENLSGLAAIAQADRDDFFERYAVTW